MESAKQKLDRLWNGAVGDRLELVSDNEKILHHVPKRNPLQQDALYLIIPPPARITRYCGNFHCKGERFFQLLHHQNMITTPEENGVFSAVYLCGNCTICKVVVVVSMSQETNEGKRTVTACKLAEDPIRYAPISGHLRSILGPDLDLMTKGLRCEQLGLGVGAASYYRRIVEDRKNTLLDEIRKVCVAIGGHEAAIAELEKAKGETQFSKAIDMVSSGLPESLKIEGHNPLTLLHSALSQNIHADHDEECLVSAKATRVVLVELARRIDETLKERSEVALAVAELNKKASERNGRKQGK